MLAFVVTGIVFCIDWLSKFYVKLNLSPGASVPIINDFFYLTYLKNRGIIFGLFFPPTISIIVVSGIIITVLLFLLGKISLKSRWQEISLGLLWGGVLGNFFDRLWDGSVIDFINFRFWPVFNIADIAICIGAVLLFIGILKSNYLSRST
jgi:signal peptidase II